MFNDVAHTMLNTEPKKVQSLWLLKCINMIDFSFYTLHLFISYGNDKLLKKVWNMFSVHYAVNCHRLDITSLYTLVANRIPVKTSYV